MKEPFKKLNLTQLEAVLPQILEGARREQWTYETFLEHALAIAAARTRAASHCQAAQGRTVPWEENPGRV